MLQWAPPVPQALLALPGVRQEGGRRGRRRGGERLLLKPEEERQNCRGAEGSEWSGSMPTEGPQAYGGSCQPDKPPAPWLGHAFAAHARGALSCKVSCGGQRRTSGAFSSLGGRLLLRRLLLGLGGLVDKVHQAEGKVEGCRGQTLLDGEGRKLKITPQPQQTTSRHMPVMWACRRAASSAASTSSSIYSPRPAAHPRKLMPEWLLRLISQVRLVE